VARTLLGSLAMPTFPIAAQSPAARPARSVVITVLGHLARARLVQFFAIAAALFLVAPRPPDDRRIEISSADLTAVTAAQSARQGTRTLEPAKAAEVRARWIADQMLFREGVRMGLDQGDPIIQQRVVQKVLLLAEALGGATREPTRAELRAEYERSTPRYRRAAGYHVMHVFAARRDDLPAGPLDPSALPHAGEPFPLPRETRATHDELRRAYGAAFADAIAAQSPSTGYSEPVPSSFGWHRVRVVDVAPAYTPAFEEVERQVAFDVILARREQAVRRFLDQTAARYEIAVDGTRLVDFRPALRLARHDTASGED
jgi:hypothetical protein